ncbi:MAG: hypothetical protein ACI38U_09470 [Corynebacterium sp.]|uniref:hypothetical protein n=1 Tax=unclassified Corynebacterium TaxID=2624378 RepID=UPI000969A496|nr:hypothetical protein [Corynebacterium sp. CNJ-954]OLT56049.1 hypothetical protein BJF89_13190 [Corynebacterium sp. CNJ-954]
MSGFYISDAQFEESKRESLEETRRFIREKFPDLDEVREARKAGVEQPKRRRCPARLFSTG